MGVNGEETEEEFCYSDEDDPTPDDEVYRMFLDVEDYLDAVADADNEADCLNIGGKKYTGKGCKANKKIKCKRIGLKEKDTEKVARDCMLWSKYPDRKGKPNKCIWDADKEKCNGKITISY